MPRLLPLLLLATFLASAAAAPAAVQPPRVDAQACQWFDRFVPPSGDGRAAAALPFSFIYGDRRLGPALPGWRATYSERTLDATRRERTASFADPATGLEIRCVAVAYGDFPTVEWTVYFKNGGVRDTPILSDIQGLDTTWAREGSGNFLLHYEFGTFYPFSRTDFMPQSETLEAGQSKRLIPLHGRPSGGIMPYFNLERGDGGGVIIALGWPGAWAADFACDKASRIRVTAGQELTHLLLHPGEEVRTPLMVVQFWQGDWINAQNTWRRWMLAHTLARPWGRPLRPMLTASSSAEFAEMIKANEANQIFFIDRYREEKIPIDCWWMDAGWYVNHGRWAEPIAWEVDRARFPRGLRYISDHAHSLGLKTIVWFEPERVMPTNSLFKTHPDWLLPNRMRKMASRLLYLGNPDALKWLTDTVSRIITEEGIDVYRQDFNVVEPVELWRSNDTPDRQGITENHHLVGYLAFWDELLRRHPGLVIDSCAGGGSRDDLETMRRALPFYRSDFLFDIEASQSQSYGLALWLPFIGTTAHPWQISPYELRSTMACPIFIPSWDMRDRKLPYDAIRKAVGEWKSYADCYLGDYYPLTPDRLDSDVWIAWQYDKPAEGRGLVQAFRHVESGYESARFTLRGLDPEARYLISDLDHPAVHPVYTGRELMDRGLEVTIAEKPGAAVLLYTRQKQP